MKIDDDARATVLFGDGVEGARLPSGDHNLRATYRKSLGLAGNVAAGKITNLLSRPLGVTGASNPAPATGGEDPETIDKARSNAPVTVLTLDRAVSIRDYQDFARAFAGIAKAHALWIAAGPARGVFLTVAGELRRGGAGDERHVPQPAGRAPSVRRSADAARAEELSRRALRLRAAVKVSDDADATLVLPQIEARAARGVRFRRARLRTGRVGRRGERDRAGRRGRRGRARGRAASRRHARARARAPSLRRGAGRDRSPAPRSPPSCSRSTPARSSWTCCHERRRPLRRPFRR